MLEKHPDRNALDRFSRGEAPVSEELWIETHLRTGCTTCQEEVDELLRPALDAALLTGIEIPVQETDDEAVWNRLSAELARRVAEVARERSAAPSLLDELLAVPAAERSRLVCSRRRFQTFALCELLLERSGEEGFEDPARALELAGLGLEAAGRLDPGSYGPSVVQDLRARAWAYLGNARRLVCDLAGAEEALTRAERLAEIGSGDPLEEARILDFRASLLSDQGRFEQASELLDVVADIYADLREPHRRGRTLISKGVILGHAGWPEEALRLLREGLSLLDWEREPRLVLSARHNLAWFLNDCGRSDEAFRYLERFRQA
jgi:tetratricopeptide (TPR) repeat protein